MWSTPAIFSQGNYRTDLLLPSVQTAQKSALKMSHIVLAAGAWFRDRRLGLRRIANELFTLASPPFGEDTKIWTLRASLWDTRIPRSSHRSVTPPRPDIFDGHFPALLHGRQHAMSQPTQCVHIGAGEGMLRSPRTPALRCGAPGAVRTILRARPCFRNA